MNILSRSFVVALLAGAMPAATAGVQQLGAQPPGGGRPGGPGGPVEATGRREATVDEFVARLLSLDTDKDGKLQKSEVGDARLHALLTRVDADRNGVVTQDEMWTLFAKESAELAKSRGMRGPGGGPGGFPGGGPRGPGGRGGPPRRPVEQETPAPPGGRPPAGGVQGRPAPGEPQ